MYDKQAQWGKSTRYDNYKGYKLHAVTTRTGLVLAYQLTTANVYDGGPVPYLFKQLRYYSIQFALGDAMYGVQEVQRKAQRGKVIFVAPLNPRNHPTRKDVFPRVIHQVLQTRWGRKLYKLRNRIGRIFASLKEKRRIEQPRWYGYKRYLFHCQLRIFIHNALCLCWFCNTISIIYWPYIL